eukprot:1219080-Ditylum_brightwellii.AAC.1
MKVKKDNTKAADFCALVAAAKRDIESGKHRQYKLGPNKFIHETRDGMDVISIVIDDEEFSDEESSGSESSTASSPSLKDSRHHGEQDSPWTGKQIKPDNTFL